MRAERAHPASKQTTNAFWLWDASQIEICSRSLPANESVSPGLKNRFVLAERKQIPSVHEKQHVLKIETSRCGQTGKQYHMCPPHNNARPSISHHK
jgi:predicted molibdopterin-dependent oxidoreductase YjgC